MGSTEAPSTLTSRRLDAVRRQHVFTMVLGLPILCLILAPLVLPRRAPSWPELGCFVVLYVIACAGIGVGYHRHFTHRAFQAGDGLRRLLAIAGSFAGQGPLLYWVALHRLHHGRADEPEDPHSPRYGFEGAPLAGFFHAHIGWMFTHPIPNPQRWAPDLVDDRVVARASRHYALWFLAGLLAPALAVGAITGSPWGALSGLLWAGLARIVFQQHVIWSINSVCHLWGSRSFGTGDASTNNGWLALPSFGESWHNNHHAVPTAALHGMRWWQLDLSGVTIRLLAGLGLAHGVKRPPERLLERERGDHQRALGNRQPAIALYERSLALTVREGRLAEAAAIARSILDLDPKRDDVLGLLERAPAPAATREAPQIEQGTADAMAEITGRRPSGLRRAVSVDEAPTLVRNLVMTVEETAEHPPSEWHEQEEVSRDVLERLPAWPLLSELPPEALRALVQPSQLVEVPAGHLLMRAGDDADALYILVDGAVTVRAAEEAHPVELGEGEVLGESCILAEGRRSADVEVARRLRALRIERAALVPLIDRWPRLGELMLEVAIRRRLSNWLAHSPLMAPFGGPERVAVGRLFEARYVAAGTVLIAEGREPAGIVLPLSGRIVLHGGGRPADEVVPGGSLILGYQELIDARPAAFEARAAIDMIALWLPASAWHELGQRHPEPRARFEQHVRGI